MTNVTWTNITNGSASSNILTLNAASNWNSRAQSTEQSLQRGDDISYTIANGSYWVVGLGHDPFGTNDSEVEYAFYMSPSGLTIYENGVKAFPSTGYITGYNSAGPYEIEISSTGDVIYKINNTTIFTSTNNWASTSNGYLHAVSYQNAVSVTGYYTKNSGGSGGGGSGGGEEEEEETTPIPGEAPIIEHILYLNTRVPK